ncbi:MAG TPA: hypothetical protein ENH57_02560, partial [Actinobacteria bacterium]|nr:hypothetical protein [Actinomycetota bacterium]
MQQKSNKDSKNQSDNSARIKKIAGTISAFLLVFFIITMIFWSILSSPGLAPGSDVPSHMFTSKYIGDYFQKYHSIPVINPYWYNGFEILHNPPGLTYLPLTLIYLLTNDIYLASRVFTWLLAILLSLSTFIVIRRKYSNLNAIIGALIYPLAPIVFMEARASYTRGLALIFFPISLYFIDRLLEEKDKVVRTSIILSFLIALSFLTHPMMGAVLIVFFSIYIFARLVLDTDLKKFRLVLWFQSIILGLGLVSWYLLPFFAEASGWTSISPEFYKELS